MKSFDNTNDYSLYEYEEIQVFIHKSLLVDENVYIYQKLKIPFFGPAFAVNGIKIIN